MKNRYHLYFASIPMVRIVLAIILGLLIQSQVHLPFTFIIIGVILFTITVLLIRNANDYHRTFSGLILTCLLVVCGMFLPQKTQSINKIPLKDKTQFTARILNEGKIKTNSIQYDIEILNINDETIWPLEKSILYTSKDSNHTLLKTGQLITTNSFFNEIQSPIMESESSYKKYLNKNGFYTTTYSSFDNLQLLEKEEQISKGIVPAIYRTRNKATKEIQQLINSSEISAFLIAITLGDKSMLDKEQKKAFAEAGLMHMLAVSGLHLGIVIPLLMLVFGRRKKDALFIVIAKSVSLITCIWIVAIFFGFSPSIQRAATMFTFLCLGNFSKYPTNSLNLLAASALFMILRDNQIVFDIGFQLSFSAMTGILLLYKPISQQWNINNKIADYIWKLSVVSICATLFTMPFSLYYFGTFPLLFLFTNIAVLPVLPILMYATYAMLLASTIIPVVAELIAIPLNFLGQYIMTVAELCSSISWASINDINIDSIQAFLLLSMLIALLFQIYQRKSRKLIPLTLGLLLTIYSSTINIYANSKSMNIVQTEVNGKPVIIYEKGDYSLVIMNEERSLSAKEKQFNLYGSSFNSTSYEVDANPINFHLVANSLTNKKDQLIAQSN